MTSETILARLTAFCKTNNLPVTENAFAGTVEEPVPDMPYIVYLLPHNSGRGSDTEINLETRELQIELYTQYDDQDRKDLAKGVKKSVLFDTEYEEFVAPVESEDCYQTAYELANLITKMKGA